MSTVTIVGAGNMGGAIAWRVIAGGNEAQVLTRQPLKVAIPGATHGRVGDPITGDIVVLALPYGAVAEVLARYEGQLDGKVLVDLTNPLDFSTFDSLVVPVGSSAAEVIAQAVPGASVLKAFNTNFAATLTSGAVGQEDTTVLVAGDDADAKAALTSVVEAGGLRAVDAGSLKRAHELEALGFLQLTLAAAGKTSWTGGFGLTA
ncbi:NADPH-dependent F420 reductase [Cellulomonas fengjieae]|uniref:NAD(P)-binding domain-containing protein n=1 Tax=Cellulomonas fengjieae TaxID=2819978 RepID=A0ABS3SFY4_9CELL|nr:NAD(P)-binding domain-containing protein [Cellulomonas fengjieae]MBO3084663.1 NAD(P)-binding domain-containing protein [Cellulomonas fengjieae]MBO3103435.1 NAD(P)-binding domain-containing protein [Cellulomonas fengjieae]QVI67013.1 NAD(P)-binding domain-containing protein [Cellulomonas fengjieae]